MFQRDSNTFAGFVANNAKSVLGEYLLDGPSNSQLHLQEIVGSLTLWPYATGEKNNGCFME